MVVKEMTLDEKVRLVHGQGRAAAPNSAMVSCGGDGYTDAIPQLGIPAVQMAASAYGTIESAGSASSLLP